VLFRVLFTSFQEATAMGNKVTGSGRVGKEIRLLDQEVAFVGVDVHKRTFDVAVWTEEREWVKTWTQPADPSALCDHLESIRSHVADVVYEAGPTGYGLYDVLCEAKFPAAVSAPSRTPTSPARRAKSDGLDARKAAFLDGKGMLTTIYVPTRQERADRQVVRRRDQVATSRKRVRNQIKSFLLFHGVAEPAGLENWSRYAVEALHELALDEPLRWTLDSMLGELTYVEKLCHEADQRIAQLARTERYAELAQRLQSVGGIGLLTTMTFLTEVPNPARFTSGREIASYLGLAPWTGRSGQSAKSGPIMKAGNRRVRTMLVEAAWQWQRNDPAAGATFRRLAARRKNSKIAIVAVARRLAILLWRLATGRQTCPPDPGGGEDEARLARES
jgi:transposase